MSDPATPTASDDALLQAMTQIAIEAGEAVMAIYRSDFSVELKSDESPVTRADVQSEALILAGLERVAPGVSVVAEEQQAAGVQAEGGDRFFLVDPLDGTKEFISRNGEFTVNIALVEKGAPILGVVLAPALGRLYRGGRGLGAELLSLPEGASRPITTRKAPTSGLVAVTSRSHSAAESQWLQRFKVASQIAAGSSLKLCLVAMGDADLYPRLGRTMEWDIAAGHAVLTAAGGCVTRLDGAPFLYGKRNQAEDSDYANPHFVAWGDADLIRGLHNGAPTA